MYFTRLSEPFIFYSDIYDLITSGKTIDVLNFINKLNEQIENEKARINPAQTLLDLFMYSGWWNFSDAEFSENLIKLLNHVENAEFRSLVSYFNAGIYLMGFSFFIDMSNNQIIGSLKKGIGSYMKKYNNVFIVEFKMFANEFNKDGLEEVVKFTEESITKAQEEKIKSDAEELGKMLTKNIEQFLDKLANNFSETRNPDRPILHLIKKDKIMSTLKACSPSEIMKINSFLEKRYLMASFIFKELVLELTFLKHMQECIIDTDLEKPLLSNYLIKSYLSPTVNKCVDALSEKQITIN